ncbi:MAG TPA: tetratricopeptide repeat protein [Gemmataceae bacterium]|nr:tetratricopeptide repeat protein [Gemmataceae bacterium]
MRLGGKKTKVALALLLVVAAFAAYRLGLHYWGLRHWHAAQEALTRRDFPQAGEHLKHCLAVWPEDTSVRLLAAQTARRQGDFDEARRQLDAYQHLGGSEKERLRELRLLLVQQGDPTDADALLTGCLNDPNSPDTYLTLEVALEEKVKLLERGHDADVSVLEGPLAQQRERAESALALWLRQRRDPADQVQGLLWRGRIDLLINQQAAVTDFRKALALDPDNFDARLNLAVALADYDPQEAVRHLEALRRRDGHNDRVAILLAIYRRGLGQLPEAEQLLDDVLATNPKHFSALLERGKVALDAGHPDQAEGFLRRALARDPKEPFAHLALSRCLHLMGKEEEAQFHQQQYSEIEAERAEADQKKGEVQRAFRRARMEDALSEGPDPAGGR